MTIDITDDEGIACRTFIMLHHQKWAVVKEFRDFLEQQRKHFMNY